MPRPASATLKRTAVIAARDLELDHAAVGRVLDRVVDEVRQHLPHLVGVGRGSAAGPARTRTRARCRAGRCTCAASTTVARELARVVRADVELDAVGVEPARPEDVVHGPREPVGLGRDHGEQVRALRLVELQVLTLERQRRAVDRGQRRAQLVRDGRDEVAAQLLEHAVGGQVAERVDGALVELDRRRSRARARAPAARAAASRRSSRSSASPRRARCPRSRPSPGSPPPPAAPRPSSAESRVTASAARFQRRTMPSRSSMKTPSPMCSSTRAASARRSTSRNSSALSTAVAARRASSCVVTRSAGP